MKEYIERAVALDVVKRTSGDYVAAWSEIVQLPAADVAEVRHGRWIFEPGKIPYCSECKEYSDDGDKGATFCPWCGVRMDKAVEMVMERLEALKDGKGD